MDRRDSLAPRMAHNCEHLPTAFPENSRERDRDNPTPDQLFYPTKPCRIILHRDAKWYLIVQEEFCIPIDHCPFCGQKLDAAIEKPLPPRPPVALEEEGEAPSNPGRYSLIEADDDGDVAEEGPVIEFEAD